MHFFNIQVVCHLIDKQGSVCLLFYFFIILVPVLSMFVINTGQSFILHGFRCKACRNETSPVNIELPPLVKSTIRSPILVAINLKMIYKLQNLESI